MLTVIMVPARPALRPTLAATLTRVASGRVARAALRPALAIPTRHTPESGFVYRRPWGPVVSEVGHKSVVASTSSLHTD